MWHPFADFIRSDSSFVACVYCVHFDNDSTCSQIITNEIGDCTSGVNELKKKREKKREHKKIAVIGSEREMNDHPVVVMSFNIS